MTSSSQSYHHGDLKNALIKAGLEILTTEGYAALSLRSVARKAGVSHTAPYNHFANKEALIGGIADEGFNRLSVSMESAAALFPDDPCQRLMEIGWGYIQFALENPDHLRVMFSGLGGEALITESKPEHNNSFEILLKAVQACQTSGEIVEGETFQLAFTAWSMVHGTAVLLINASFPPEVTENITSEQIARANINALFEGLGITQA